MTHVPRDLYRERELLTSEEKEILTLLETIWLPHKVAIIHWKGHQKGLLPEAKSNRTTDLATWEVALESVKLFPV